MNFCGKIILEDGKRFSTYDIIGTYTEEYKTIFVGDASVRYMKFLCPEEVMNITMKKQEKFAKVIKQWPNNLWINLTPIDY